METFFSYGLTDLKFGSGFAKARKIGYIADAGAGVSVTAVPPRNAAAVMATIVFFIFAPHSVGCLLSFCLSPTSEKERASSGNVRD